MKQFLLILTCLFIHYLLPAQTSAGVADSNNLPAAIEDSMVILSPDFPAPVKRKISEDSIAALKSGKEFAYMQYIDSLFRHRSIEKQNIEPPASQPKEIISNPGLRALYWLIAFVLVLFIVFKMFVGKNALFAINQKTMHKNISQPKSSDPHLSNRENALNAIADKNYRLATRFMYLDALDTLGEKGQISITPQKTNYQYAGELKNTELKKSFTTITLHYEYAWFGNFPLNKNQFTEIENEFREFKTLLS